MISVFLNEATIEDYPVIQNMARFYVYDLSRYCGLNSNDWAMPSEGLYESFDFREYFESSLRKAYIVKVSNREKNEKELAGFVLLNNDGTSIGTDWNMGEFFIISRFQNYGVGSIVANQIWNKHPGKWEVSIIPENSLAINFWEKVISNYTSNKFNRETKNIDYDEHQPQRIIFSFDTSN